MEQTMNKKPKAKKGTMARLLKMLFKRYPGKLVFAMFCIVIAAVSNFTSSIFVKNITNTISINLKNGTPFNEFWSQIVSILIIMGVFYAAGLLASFAWNYTMAIVTQRFQNDLRKTMFDHMETLPIRYFDTHAHGDIMSIYTNDTDTIRQLISQSLPNVFQTAVTVIALLAIMLYNSLWLTLIVLLGSIFMFINAKRIGGKSAKFFVKQQSDLGKVNGYIEEMISGQKVVKVLITKIKQSLILEN